MLPDIPGPRPDRTATVEGVEFTFRALTVGEVEHLQALATDDPLSTGPQTLAYAFDCTSEDADAWIRAHTPKVAMEIATAIMLASGAAESAGARFQEGVPQIRLAAGQ